MSITRALTSSMLVLVTGRVVTIAGTLAINALLVRHLHATGFGEYRTVLAYLGFGALLANLGLPLIILREISLKQADQARILGSAMTLTMLATTAFLCMLLLVSWWLPLSHTVRLGMLLGLFGFVALGVHNVLFTLFQQRLQQRGPVLAEALGAATLLLCITLLALGNAGVLLCVAATTLSNVVTLAISWHYARRLVDIRPMMDWQEWQRLLKPAAPIALANVLILLYYRCDIILLGLMKPMQEVGYYGIASKMLDTLIGFSLLLTNLFMPLLSRHVHHDTRAFNKCMQSGLETLLIGMVGVLIIVQFYAETIVTLIGGPQAEPAAYPLRVLGILAVVASLSLMHRQGVTAYNQHHHLLVGYVAAVVCGVTAYMLLIPRFGGLGAALSLLVGETVVGLRAIWLLRKLGMVYKWSMLWKIALAATATCFFLGVGRRYGMPWFMGMLGGPALYTTLLLAMQAIPVGLLLELVAPGKSALESR